MQRVLVGACLLVLAHSYLLFDALAVPLGTAAPDRNSNQSIDQPESEYEIAPPIRHYKSDQGIPLALDPSIEDQIKKEIDQRSPNLSMLKEKLERARSEAATKPTLPGRNSSLIPCFEDRTEKKDLDLGLELKSDVALSDYLFITKYEMPKKLESQFGQRTVVLLYDLDKQESPTHDIARGMGVPCVPFRLRTTAKHIYRHYGKDALKNFDQITDHVEKGGKKL